MGPYQREVERQIRQAKVAMAILVVIFFVLVSLPFWAYFKGG